MDTTGLRLYKKENRMAQYINDIQVNKNETHMHLKDIILCIENNTHEERILGSFNANAVHHLCNN